MRIFSKSMMLLVILVACGQSGGGVAVPVDPNLTDALVTCPQCLVRAYAPADGFVVHEWGTLTSVLGSDGSLLPGLHHEEDDLPGFVADRVAQVTLAPGTNTNQKMETPVTYFYSPVPQTIGARVSFTNGILTQWFPWVRELAPSVYNRDGVVLDSWLSSSRSNELPASCSAKFRAPLSQAYSFLDWGSVRVLARDATPTLAGPIGDRAWKFARNVASNPLEVTSPTGDQLQHEKFLFYRGLGDFQLPLTATVKSFCKNEHVTFNYRGTGVAGKVLLMLVTSQGGSFVEVGDVGAKAVESDVYRVFQPLPEFVASLKKTLMTNLIADGLYTDEAKAMVDTWERSYFLTPGLRALYLLPQPETEAIIPLTITPNPAVMKRTMVIRLELLSPANEAELSTALTKLAHPETAAAAHADLLARGRFAEPHLTRAVTLTTDAAERAAGEALLEEVRGVRRWAPVTAE